MYVCMCVPVYFSLSLYVCVYMLRRMGQLQLVWVLLVILLLLLFNNQIIGASKY